MLKKYKNNPSSANLINCQRHLNNSLENWRRTFECYVMYCLFKVDS